MASRVSATESTTSLFAIPGYSKLMLMPPESPSTLVEKLYFRGHVWHVKVSTGGFKNGVPDYVSVRVCALPLRHSASGTNISIEILDNSREHTMFHKEEILGNGTSFKSLIVKRSELEAASCVDNDNILVRCTLTFLKVKMHKRLLQAAARANWWFRFRGSLQAQAAAKWCHQLRKGSSSNLLGRKNSNVNLTTSFEPKDEEIPTPTVVYQILTKPDVNLTTSFEIKPDEDPSARVQQMVKRFQTKPDEILDATVEEMLQRPNEASDSDVAPLLITAYG